MPNLSPRVLWDTLQGDLRYAMRRLARDWSFTLGAILILTLGIGANTAIFSVINMALFQSFGVREPERVVNIYENLGEERRPFASSYPVYRDVAGYTDLYQDVAASTIPMGLQYQGSDGLRTGIGEFATSNYLQVLGLTPTAGRWLSAADDQPGTDPVAVIGYRSWVSRFASDRGIIGRTIYIQGLPVTVVGIGPQTLRSTVGAGVITDYWLSISALPTIGPDLFGGTDLLERRPQRSMFLLKARLRDGIEAAQAQAAMDVLGKRLAAEYPGQDLGQGITVLPSTSVRVHPQFDAILAPIAALLLTLVGLVLAIACSNLATLLLVRGNSRSKEVSVRLAVGATRGQILRHLLTESVLLSLAGAIGGYFLAGWGIRILGTLNLPITLDLALDMRVLGYTLALSVVTGIVFGLAPALRSSRLDLISELRDQGSATRSRRRWFNLKNGLLVVQVSASCVLLIAAAATLNSISATQSAETGFAIDGVSFIQTDPRYAGYTGQREQAFLRDAVARLERIPGVQAAALASDPPGSIQRNDPLVIPGLNVAPEQAPSAPWLIAGPGYFDALQIPILYGRAFNDSDQPNGAATAIVNMSMARQLFGSPNAVGRIFALLRDAGKPIEIVGVVPDTLTLGLNEPPQPLFYRPAGQARMSAPTILARSSLDAASLARSMQQTIRDLDPAAPVTRVTTMRQHVADLLLPVKAMAGVLAALGALGLVLAAIGLYAVVSYSVSQRTTEVGLRMALGADRHQVVWMISRDVIALIGVGMVMGAALAAVGARLANAAGSAAPGVNIDAVPAPEANPVVLLSVGVLISLIGILATYIPARRAAQVDPLVALRHQ